MTSTEYVNDDYWQPRYSEGDNGTPEFSPLDTVAAQYRDSSTLLQLIANFNQYVSPDLDFQKFNEYVWNIDTAQGFGLDILGRVIGSARQFEVPAIYPNTEAPGLRNLNDDQYRTLLRAKALSNISGSSAPEINAALRLLFGNRGTAYATDLGNMRMQYKFLFALEPIEFAIMAQSNAVPKPAAVKTSMFNVQPYFGFSEAESWSTFGEAPFASY